MHAYCTRLMRSLDVFSDYDMFFILFSRLSDWKMKIYSGKLNFFTTGFMSILRCVNFVKFKSFSLVEFA